MVFCNTVKQTELLAEALQAIGHEGKPPKSLEHSCDI
jgi:hypothetical protein